MKSAKSLPPIILVVMAMVALSSCNLPTSPDPNILAMTIVAQTQQAQVSADNPASVAPTAAPVSSQPTANVSTATNCRTGPDIQYEFVWLMEPGVNVKVVGKYSPSNYWIIEMPSGGTCWLWGQYASVQGDVSQLPEMTPPQLVIVQPTATQKKSKGNNNNPTPTATKSGLVLNPNLVKVIALPAAPSKLKVTTACQYVIFTQTVQQRIDSLQWTSVNNATGYKVYVNGGQVTQVSGTSYQTISAPIKGPISFAVAAYNSFGTSAKTSHSSSCP